MMNTADDRIIQRYVDEEMSEEEKQDFEIKLLQTETLRERVEEYRFIAEGIQYHGEMEAWQKIQALEEEAIEEESERNPYMTKWLYRGIAASLFLLMVGVPLYWQQDEMRYARIFEQNFEAYQALGGATRGGTNEQPTFVLPEAFEAYHEKQYPQAISLFKEASTQEDRPYIWLYLGNAYLSNDQAQEAIGALQHVLTYSNVDENTRLRTHWYLGLAHLKLNHEEEAAQHFKMLQDTDDYGQKARTILKSIH